MKRAIVKVQTVFIVARRASHIFFKGAPKIRRRIKTNLFADLFPGQLRAEKQFFGILNADIVFVFNRRHADLVFKHGKKSRRR